MFTLALLAFVVMMFTFPFIFLYYIVKFINAYIHDVFVRGSVNEWINHRLHRKVLKEKTDFTFDEHFASFARSVGKKNKR